MNQGDTYQMAFKCQNCLCKFTQTFKKGTTIESKLNGLTNGQNIISCTNCGCTNIQKAPLKEINNNSKKLLLD